MANSRLKQSSVTGNPVLRMFNIIRAERKDIILIYLYSILSGLISLAFPLGIQAIMGLVLAGTVTSSWVILMALVVFSLGFGGFLSILQLSISERLQQRIFVNAAFEFAYRVPRWKYESIMKEYAPELMNRFFDILTIQKSLSKILIGFSTSFLQIVFGIILLSFYHAYFAMFGILTFVLMLVVFRLSFNNALKSSLMESKYKYKIAAWLEELGRTMGIVKLAGKTDMHIKKTDRLTGQYVKYRQKHFKELKFQYINVVTFKTLITAGLLIVGSILVINQQINIGQFVASEIVIILIVNSVEKLMESIETIFDVLTSVEKIGLITDIDIEEDTGIPFSHIDKGPGIEMVFKDVNYSFPGTNRVTLKNINLDVKAGQKICVAGYPGAGRSTMIHLAASLYHNYTGFITINGTTLKNLNLIDLRSYVGENLAKKEIINGTYAENISMGVEETTFEDIKKAADAVNLTEFIQSTERGWDTEIVPEDLTLPSNVVKKIAMARSIAENPRLFILDDFLTGLSIEDKDTIVKALTGSDKPWTLLGASNQEVFAKACDKIIIMKEGAVIDEGTYDEIKTRSYFADIFVP